MENRIILLHLTSIMDSWALSCLCGEMSKQMLEPGFLRLWPKLLSDLLKSLVLMFYMSNIVMITSQTPRFDVSYINMFRIIDTLRIKLQPFVTEMLQNFDGNLPSALLKTGRLSVPQLLFIFNAHHSAYHYINEDNVASHVQMLEEQIIRIFRRSRLLNNTNPLFQLNSNLPLKPFVYISLRNPNIANFSQYFYQKLLERCAERENNSFDRHQDLSNDIDHGFLNFLMSNLNSMGRARKSENSIEQPCDPMPATKLFHLMLHFKELIFSQTYTNIAPEKAKNLKKVFESLTQTLDADGRFSETRCSKMITNSVNFYQEGLPSHYNRETHRRKLMLAIQNFTMQCRGPSIYKYIQMLQNDCEAYWNNGHKMCEELSLTGNACVNKLHRTPSDDICESNVSSEMKNLPVMLHNSMIKIISACDCGRRQGNRDDPFTTKAANYAFYQKMKYKCHTCVKIPRIVFPFYDVSKIVELDTIGTSQTSKLLGITKRSDESSGRKTSSPSAGLSLDEETGAGLGAGTGGGESLEHFLNDEEVISSELGRLELISQDEDCSIGYDEIKRDDVDDENNQAKVDEKIDAHSDDQEDDDYHDEEEVAEELEEEEEEDGNAFISEDDDDGEEEDAGQRADVSGSVGYELDELSTAAALTMSIDIKSLAPMLHTLLEGHQQRLARFSSWSLVCLGSSRIYSHNVGIQDQQGFIHGSHYLLPWNVSVMLQHGRGRRMPTLWEGKRPPGIKHKKTLRNGTQFTVKIFIGVEYECFNGHRFICSAPDQVLKTNTNIFRDVANDVATNDMPIYMHCMCR